MNDRSPRGAKGRPAKLAALLFWLLAWHGIAVAVGKPFLLVTPANAAARLWALAVASPERGGFWLSVAATCGRVLAGFVLAVLLGGLLALFSARSALARALFSPLLGVVRATPVASFIILAVVFLPTGRLPVFIAFLMVLPLAYSNLTAGLGALDKRLLEMTRLFRVPRLRTLRLVWLPGLMPYVTAAATAGLGFAWKSAIAAEIIVHPSLSVGKRIWEAKIYFETPDLFAWTAAVVLLSVLLEQGALRALAVLERRMAVGKWKMESGSAKDEGGGEDGSSMSAGKPVEVRGLSKSYGERTVLERLSLTLEKPGVTALMGPSGSGKTTLLRILAGLERPDAGEVCGVGVVSMAFQEDRLLPQLSARDNILAVAPRGKRPHLPADRLLAGCGLSDAADKLPAGLSGGMRRRVAVARALAVRYDLLLLDEPFAGLDAKTKEDMFAFLEESLPKSGRCLLVTHDAEDAARLAHTIIRFPATPTGQNARIPVE